jgi:hypothetical protein
MKTLTVMGSIATAGMLLITPVSATTIDFSALGGAPYNLSNGSVIPQTFGDTAEADATYASLNGGANWGSSASVSANNVRYWGNNYSGDAAAYANANGNKFQMTLSAATGLKFTDFSFDFGAWPNLSRYMNFQIFDEAWNLISDGRIRVNGAVNSGLNLGFTQDLTRIVLQFGDDFNVGLRSFSYTTASTADPSVPLPAGLVFALTGLLSLAGTGRMKSRSSE